jgi:hypothetical protein
LRPTRASGTSATWIKIGAGEQYRVVGVADRDPDTMLAPARRGVAVPAFLTVEPV